VLVETRQLGSKLNKTPSQLGKDVKDVIISFVKRNFFTLTRAESLHYHHRMLYFAFDRVLERNTNGMIRRAFAEVGGINPFDPELRNL
jgi:hypothetical protein